MGARRYLGVVPARGGSQGIPRKNLVDLGGRPLLAHTAEAALGARGLDRVVLSTDDDEIAEVGAGLGLDVPFLRPAHLAGPETPMLDVLQHLLGWLTDAGEPAPEAVVLLQPTSPLRTTEDIERTVERFEATGADSAVTVVEVPHAFTPACLYRLGPDGFVTPLETGVGPVRRQDKPRLYARNGPAVLVVRTSVVAAGAVYGERTLGVVMPKLRSVDIDDADDLALARALVRS